MKSSRIHAALAIAASLSLLAGCGGIEEDVASSAVTAEQQICLDGIAELQQGTAAVWVKAERDRTGLAGKLTEAALKLESGKPADAVQKLGDFALKVSTLAAQRKIGPSADGTVTPASLVDGAQRTMDCIIPPPPPEPTPVQ